MVSIDSDYLQRNWWPDRWHAKSSYPNLFKLPNLHQLFQELSIMGTIERSALYINCSSFHFSFLSQFNPSFLTLHKHTLELTLWACSTTNQMRLRLTMRSVFSPLFQFIELIVPWYLFSAGTLNTRQSYLTRSLLLLHLTRYIGNVYPPSNHTLIISFPY